MRAASAGLISLLNSGQQLQVADLYTLTLYDGTVLRYTSADLDITVGGNTYSSTGPKAKRGKTSQKIGLQVDSLTLEVYPAQTDLVKGLPFLAFATAGGLDGAYFALDYCFMGPAGWGDTSLGTLPWFMGRVSETDVSRTSCTLKINSDVELLSQMLPRNVYQDGCVHTLYDSGCTLIKATYTVSGTTAVSSTQSLVYASGFAQATGYFDLGVLTFTSGANNGSTHAIKTYTTGSPGSFLLNYPLSNAPAAGDTFTVYPGCDKLQTTCTSKYNNLANFRGYPYIPVPEASM